MEARSRVQWSIAILFGVAPFCLPVFADQVYNYKGEFNLQIPDEPDASKGWMADAVIEVDCHLTIFDIDVGISLTHSNVFDLQISLQSPNGTTLSLNKYDVGNEFFQGADYSQTVFDDEAENNIYESQPPFTGRFRPNASNGLEVFDGQDAYGPWHLQIYDAYYYDIGTLDSFELTITTPEPTTVVLLALGTGFAALFRPRRRQ
ncbi:MAG: proprotein convertase P-domain-containing protein [Sedimentisphaerales bacterium]